MSLHPEALGQKTRLSDGTFICPACGDAVPKGNTVYEIDDCGFAEVCEVCKAVIED